MKASDIPDTEIFAACNAFHEGRASTPDIALAEKYPPKVIPRQDAETIQPMQARLWRESSYRLGKGGASMNVIICGSRDWADRKSIEDFIHKRMGLSDVLIHGGAQGADTIAGEIWKEVNITKGSLRVYKADWERYGRSAGAIRNREMLDKEKVDLVMAFPLGESRGTWNMIREAKRRGIPVEIYGE